MRVGWGGGDGDDNTHTHTTELKCISSTGLKKEALLPSILNTQYFTLTLHFTLTLR